LGIIPGVVRSLPNENWHIGWNSIELISQDSLFTKSNGESFYFNHSYVFDASNDFSIAFSEINKSKFTVAVRRDNVVGLQFHPEKSQYAGKKLLSHIVESLCCG
jgi:glutamine amidotransferase